MTDPIRVIPWTSPRAPRLSDHGPSTRARTNDEDLAWARDQAANPALHDAPIFAFLQWDAHAGTIAAVRSSYALLVSGRPPITALGVSGVLLRASPNGPQVLLGLRASRTRIYSACWETAPRGAVPVPIGPTSPDLLVDALRQESLEELTGPKPDWQRALAMVIDPGANSVDVVFQAHVSEHSSFAPGSWEYDDLRWIPLPLARAWACGQTPPPPFHPDHRLSPPTAALLAADLL